ncbi:putative transmembrane protein 244 [Ambystoma mexicanum]|uniref:putative transmembrane protein 244 n=1 Tax=Ambystoma mexicanum TaxID=8296 RepID=UPI0037E8EF4B
MFSVCLFLGTCAFMAIRIKLAETKTVLQNLLMCLTVFYTVYYLVLGICFVTFRLQIYDGLAPFNFKTNPSWANAKYIVGLISLEATFFICGLLFAIIVEEWIWDYAITITVIHIIACSSVMQEFPKMAHWWVALGSGLFSMISGGQILAYILFKDNFIYPILNDF